MPPEMTLRPLRVSDEKPFRRAHAAMAEEGFSFGLFLDEDESFSAYVEGLALNARSMEVSPDRVPSTFLVAVVDRVIVGRTSIRHRLNGFLTNEGGHIGYGVLAEHRGRGHATEILRQSLVIARSLDVGDVLLFCDDDNPASARVIEKCGGILTGRPIASDGGILRRYVIPGPDGEAVDSGPGLAG